MKKEEREVKSGWRERRRDEKRGEYICLYMYIYRRGYCCASEPTPENWAHLSNWDLLDDERTVRSSSV